MPFEQAWVIGGQQKRLAFGAGAADFGDVVAGLRFDAGKIYSSQQDLIGSFAAAPRAGRRLGFRRPGVTLQADHRAA